MKRFIFIVLTGMFVLFSAGCGTGQKNSGLQIAEHVEYGQNDYQKITAANNKLGFSLLDKVEHDKDGNMFISPFSLFTALSMVYNGTDGITKEEIASVLHVTGMDRDELSKANASLMQILYNQADEIELNYANSIWINERFHFQELFADNVKDYFNAKVTEMNVTDDSSVKMINDWVSEATNGKINEIVEGPLNPDLVAILINALYFKGDWLHSFDKKRTDNRPFYLADGSEKNVPLMAISEKLEYMENEYFQAVSLPYKGEEWSMKVFLPKKELKLEQFRELLTYDNWEVWLNDFSKQEGTLLLPKFQLEYEISLNESLKKLGMESAFGKGAEFPNMIQESDPIWIDSVKQKTFLEVNEEGTEAAAATSVEIVTESAVGEPPFYMEVNRPFFLTIQNDKTGTILFMGEINNPPVN